MIKILIGILIIWNIVIIFLKKKKRKRKIPEKIKIFNIGSSHGLCSFDYADIQKVNCYNFGWHSQTFYYDYIVLKNYFNKIAENGICFIPISYFSFADKKCWNKQDMTYRKTLKFYYLEGEDRKEAFILQYLPLYVSIKKKMLKLIKVKHRKDTKIKSGIERIKKHVEILENQNEKNSVMKLEEIIKLLSSKKIKIILITTPFQVEYNKYFKKELLEEKFYKIINEIATKYNLTYYDYSKSYNIFGENEYFNDYDHLSKKGAKIFMKEIKKIIMELSN